MFFFEGIKQEMQACNDKKLEYMVESEGLSRQHTAYKDRLHRTMQNTVNLSRFAKKKVDKDLEMYMQKKCLKRLCKKKTLLEQCKYRFFRINSNCSTFICMYCLFASAKTADTYN